MTQDRFIKLLQHPELLASISYEELKTAALAYPYAHNLRYLLAIKARQIGHADAARTLITASAYSLDRSRLHALLSPVSVLAPVREEVLELKPVAELQRQLEAREPLPRAAAPESPKPSFAMPPVEPPPPPTPIEPDTSESDVMQEQDLTEPTPSTPSTSSTPSTPATFIGWLAQFQPPVLEGAPAPVEAEPVEETPRKPAAEELAARSLSEDREVVTETLARLMAKQGFKTRAIAMYEQLRLVFPEKSDYFAAEIEKLKK